MTWLLTLLLGSAEPPVSHEIHSTLTVASLQRDSLDLRIRVFADDFSASVAAFAGRRTPADSSVREAEADRYVRAKVMVLDGKGRSVPLARCGLTRVRETYLLCYRAPAPAGSAFAMFSNELLMERYEDQVNVVQFADGFRRRSTLFTSATSVAPFAPRAR
jgi:hypothetical protein